jgi:hypothetical protein
MKNYELIPIEQYEFPKNSNQENRARALSAEYILYWDHDCRGNLPKYVWKKLEQEGYEIKKIGYTTYRSNTFAIYKKQGQED